MSEGNSSQSKLRQPISSFSSQANPKSTQTQTGINPRDFWNATIAAKKLEEGEFDGSSFESSIEEHNSSTSSLASNASVTSNIESSKYPKPRKSFVPIFVSKAKIDSPSEIEHNKSQLDQSIIENRSNIDISSANNILQSSTSIRSKESSLESSKSNVSSQARPITLSIDKRPLYAPRAKSKVSTSTMSSRPVSLAVSPKKTATKPQNSLLSRLGDANGSQLLSNIDVSSLRSRILPKSTSNINASDDRSWSSFDSISESVVNELYSESLESSKDEIVGSIQSSTVSSFEELSNEDEISNSLFSNSLSASVHKESPVRDRLYKRVAKRQSSGALLDKSASRLPNRKQLEESSADESRSTWSSFASDFDDDVSNSLFDDSIESSMADYSIASEAKSVSGNSRSAKMSKNTTKSSNGEPQSRKMNQSQNKSTNEDHSIDQNESSYTWSSFADQSMEGSVSNSLFSDSLASSTHDKSFSARGNRSLTRSRAESFGENDASANSWSSFADGSTDASVSNSLFSTSIASSVKPNHERDDTYYYNADTGYDDNDDSAQNDAAGFEDEEDPTTEAQDDAEQIRKSIPEKSGPFTVPLPRTPPAKRRQNLGASKPAYVFEEIKTPKVNGRPVRKRVPTLDFHRNERIVYGLKNDGSKIPTILGVIRNTAEAEDAGQPKRRKLTESFSEEPVPMLTSLETFDMETGNSVHRTVSIPRPDFKPISPGNQRSLLAEAFGWMSGWIKLMPQTLQQFNQDSAQSKLFFVCRGQVVLQIGDGMTRVDQGGVFIVPPGNPFSIRNISTHNSAQLAFVAMPGDYLPSSEIPQL